MFCLVFFRWGNRGQTFRGIPGIYLTNGALADYTAMIFSGHLVAVRAMCRDVEYLSAFGWEEKKKERKNERRKQNPVDTY